MKNFIKTIVFFSALCTFVSLSFSQVNDNTGNAGIHSGDGTFKATIVAPLSIYNTQPLLSDIVEYVKGNSTLTYDAVDNAQEEIKFQYTILGELGRNIFIKIVEPPPVVAGLQTKTDNLGVSIIVKWTVKNGHTNLYVSETNPYQLVSSLGMNGSGGVLVWARVTKVIIEPTATSGNHTFTQTIEVSYNPF